MKNNQGLQLLEEEIQSKLDSGELVLDGVEEMQPDGIGFDIETISSFAGVTEPDGSEFDKGVFEASQYIGQFSALINAGMDSDTAIVVMSWIREDKLNKDNINGQIELAKQESIKIKRESL